MSAYVTNTAIVYRIDCEVTPRVNMDTGNTYSDFEQIV